MRFAIFDCRFVLIALVAVATGCASRPAPEKKSPVEPPLLTTRKASAPQAILYQRTGGIAGTDDRVVIWPDGLVSVRGKLMPTGSVRLNEADLAKIQSLMANFSQLKDDYPDGSADAYQITISCGEKSVTASDLSPQLPEDFKKIFTAIEAVAAQAVAPTP